MSEFDRSKWDARYSTSGFTVQPPSPFLEQLDSLLPRAGRALDVAGGAGRNALLLAKRGLDVTIADVSREGLARAAEAATSQRLSIRTVQADFDIDPLPGGEWDIILCVDYLWRELVKNAAEFLRPGGLLVYSIATKENLRRHVRPPADFLLEDGELPNLVQGLEVEFYGEGWTPSFGHGEGACDGSLRHEARLCAKKPSPA